MGASAWSYFVPYQPDLNAALEELQAQVFTEGDYWWARGEFGKPASAYANRPTSIDDLFDDEWVQESGTHSILDMHHVLAAGEEPDYGTVEPVTTTEALQYAGVELPTRDHVDGLDGIPTQRYFGRCAVLYDANGKPCEIYFWGYSGD